MIEVNDVKKIASHYSKDSRDADGFATLWTFLRKNPDLFGWRGKKKPDLADSSGATKLAEKYFNSKFEKVTPIKPKTVPDELVSVILNKFYNYSPDKLLTLKIEHQDAMCAENMVGDLLERYLDSTLRNHGWVWCCAALVKHVDFIKYENNAYRLLQIKNRDNSENSSSKAIRAGTTIEHWFRTFSKTGLTNWDAFPDRNHKDKLNEHLFIDFVRNYR